MKYLLFLIVLFSGVRSFAQKVYSVQYENQADFKIYFVEYKNQAGWRNKSKQHFMF